MLRDDSYRRYRNRKNSSNSVKEKHRRSSSSSSDCSDGKELHKSAAISGQRKSSPAKKKRGNLASTDMQDTTFENLTEEEKLMRQMGFAQFNTSKGKLVKSNHLGPAKGAVKRKPVKRKFKQYMNRRGGFNQLL